jgi:hypothetical protein
MGHLASHAVDIEKIYKNCNEVNRRLGEGLIERLV